MDAPLFISLRTADLTTFKKLSNLSVYKWTSSGSGTITAPAGQLVYITFNAESTALSVNFTLTGATLSGPTGNTIFVSDNYVVQSFTMPSSGTVSWTGTFTPGTGQGEIDVN